MAPIFPSRSPYLETQQKPSKHCIRPLPHIPAVFKLREILGQVLLGNVDMRSTDAAPKHAPEAFERIGVR